MQSEQTYYIIEKPMLSVIFTFLLGINNAPDLFNPQTDLSLHGSEISCQYYIMYQLHYGVISTFLYNAVLNIKVLHADVHTLAFSM